MPNYGISLKKFVRMKQKLLLLGVLVSLTLTTSAQERETVDPIDVETGVIYYSDSTQVSDTISTDTIDCANPPIPHY